ncbi:hypothetical protein DYB32_008141, partial [Aphanomyces invadans]
MEGFGGGLWSLSKHVLLSELVLLTGEAPLALKNVSAWVDTTDSGLNITVGRPVMEALGNSTEDLLKTASVTQDAYNSGDLSVLDLGGDSSPSRALKARYAQMLAESGDLDDFEDDDVPTIDGNPKLAVRRILEQRVQEAQGKGLSESGAIRMRDLLREFEDVFRVQFQDDPTVAVDPLQ